MKRIRKGRYLSDRSKFLLKNGVHPSWTRLRWFKYCMSDTLARLDEHKYPKQMDLILRPWQIPFKDVKVVIIGHAPFRSKVRNTGLAYSLPFNYKRHKPAGTTAIIQEYMNDLNLPEPASYSLSAWHSRGIMLLNTTLVRDMRRTNNSYNLGWEYLIYETLRKLSTERKGLVFILFGNRAKKLKVIIDETSHLCICLPSASPVSSRHYSAILGTKFFSQALNYLKLDKSFFKLPSNKRI